MRPETETDSIKLWNEANDVVNSVLGPDVKVGVDFNTEFLSNAKDEDISRAQALMVQASQNRRIGCATIATNVVSFKPATKLIHWTRSLGIHCIATEVLRAHSARPALVSPLDGVAFQQRLEVSEAVEKFQRMMNACVKLEKHFIEKVWS